MDPLVNSIAYLGPERTFTHEALCSIPELAKLAAVPCPTITSVFRAVETGQTELGFVPIENAIEGTVSATMDSLVFDFDLRIQHEVICDVHLQLASVPGADLSAITKVYSYPHALGQCQHFFESTMPGAELLAANSTADGARLVAELSDPTVAALAPRLAADFYGLEVLAADVEDHSGNQTRFVAVAKSGVPAATGHDRTSIVCFQRADQPGSLQAILGQFSARDINLTKLESRPTKQGLGSYCFVIDMEGHLEDEMVADCLRNLHAELGAVKFLGSYPAAGPAGPDRRREFEEAWSSAEDWLARLRSELG